MQDQPNDVPKGDPSLEYQVEQLLDKVDGVTTTAHMVEALVANTDLIRSIAAACESTQLFQRAKAKFDQFAAELELDTLPEHRLPFAWNHFLETVAQAPTRLHLMSTVRICMPLVARYLATDTNTAQL